MIDGFKSLLVEKYRPQTLDDLILSEENKKYFMSLKELGTEIPHLLFWGQAGGGKTSLAKILVNNILDCNYIYINSSDERGIDTIREKIINFIQTKSIDGKLKVVICDEFDGATSDGQRALRNVMESYADNARFILTCNSINRIVDPLKSRCVVFEIVPPLKECAKRCFDVLKKENIKTDPTQLDLLLKVVKNNFPDLRKMLNTIQKYTINGELKLNNIKEDYELSKQIIEKLIKKEDIFSIRKYIIEKESQFNNDYHFLLKGLFEEIYSHGMIKPAMKSCYLEIIAESMYKHQFVLDKEINFIDCIIKLGK